MKKINLFGDFSFPSSSASRFVWQELSHQGNTGDILPPEETSEEVEGGDRKSGSDGARADLNPFNKPRETRAAIIDRSEAVVEARTGLEDLRAEINGNMERNRLIARLEEGMARMGYKVKERRADGVVKFKRGNSIIKVDRDFHVVKAGDSDATSQQVVDHILYGAAADDNKDPKPLGWLDREKKEVVIPDKQESTVVQTKVETGLSEIEKQKQKQKENLLSDAQNAVRRIEIPSLDDAIGGKNLDAVQTEIDMARGKVELARNAGADVTSIEAELAAKQKNIDQVKTQLEGYNKAKEKSEEIKMQIDEKVKKQEEIRSEGEQKIKELNDRFTNLDKTDAKKLEVSEKLSFDEKNLETIGGAKIELQKFQIESQILQKESAILVKGAQDFQTEFDAFEEQKKSLTEGWDWKKGVAAGITGVCAGVAGFFTGGWGAAGGAIVGNKISDWMGLGEDESFKKTKESHDQLQASFEKNTEKLKQKEAAIAAYGEKIRVADKKFVNEVETEKRKADIDIDQALSAVTNDSEMKLPEDKLNAFKTEIQNYIDESMGKPAMEFGNEARRVSAENAQANKESVLDVTKVGGFIKNIKVEAGSIIEKVVGGIGNTVTGWGDALVRDKDGNQKNMFSQFAGGIVRSVGKVVEGVGYAAAHPVDTVVNLATSAVGYNKDTGWSWNNFLPVTLFNAIFAVDSIKQDGWAAGSGEALGNVAMILFTGGASGAARAAAIEGKAGATVARAAIEGGAKTMGRNLFKRPFKAMWNKGKGLFKKGKTAETGALDEAAAIDSKISSTQNKIKANRDKIEKWENQGDKLPEKTTKPWAGSKGKLEKLKAETENLVKEESDLVAKKGTLSPKTVQDWDKSIKAAEDQVKAYESKNLVSQKTWNRGKYNAAKERLENLKSERNSAVSKATENIKTLNQRFSELEAEATKLPKSVQLKSWKTQLEELEKRPVGEQWRPEALQNEFKTINPAWESASNAEILKDIDGLMTRRTQIGQEIRQVRNSIAAESKLVSKETSIVSAETGAETGENISRLERVKKAFAPKLTEEQLAQLNAMKFKRFAAFKKFALKNAPLLTLFGLGTAKFMEQVDEDKKRGTRIENYTDKTNYNPHEGKTPETNKANFTTELGNETIPVLKLEQSDLNYAKSLHEKMMSGLSDDEKAKLKEWQDKVSAGDTATPQEILDIQEKAKNTLSAQDKGTFEMMMKTKVNQMSAEDQMKFMSALFGLSAEGALVVEEKK